MNFKKALAITLNAYLLAALVGILVLSQWRLIYQQPVPDFADIEQPAERKKAFFEYMRPLADRQNQLIQLRRERLLALAEAQSNEQTPLSSRQLRQINNLAKRYGVNTELAVKEKIAILLKRVDTLPPSLVLVQAANESAWGRSRFAREGNNYFGQWCFREGCGLVPSKRSSGAYHEVRRFSSPAESVAAYMHNLNTHRAYRQLRDLRAQLRSNPDQTPTGYQLAGTLTRYSERGESYVQEIRNMIVSNDLDQAR